MTAVQRNEELNDLLVKLARCLLQYVEDAWPWTAWGDSTETRAKVYELIAGQRGDVEALAELLAERDWPIDPGAFPDYTDYHYVALDYLLDRLANEQRALVAEVEAAVHVCEDDADALPLVRQVAENQRGILAELESLARSPSASWVA